MKTVEESLRDLIAFSEKQHALEMRRLEAEGKPKKNAKADAYAIIINQLASNLSTKDDDPKNNTGDKPGTEIIGSEE